MNVVGSRPDGWWRDRTSAMRRLVEQLDAFAAERGERLVVVFDGRARELGAARAEVAFATGEGRDAADAEIVRRVEAAEPPGSIRVVTSDAALAREVTARGAHVLAAGRFRRQLDALGPRTRSARTGESG
jgi:predicted RNA-binding protein with PIN domain